MKYCSNCGSKVEGSFCTNCGAKVQDAQVNNVGLDANQGMNNGFNNEVNAYFQKQIDAKKNHNGYRVAVGVIMIVLGAIMLFAGIVIQSALNSANVLTRLEYAQYVNINLTFAIILPSLLVLAGGILSIISKKNNMLLLISGISYLVAAVCNICAISDISILAILCLVFGPINIVFYTKTR